MKKTLYLAALKTVMTSAVLLGTLFINAAHADETDDSLTKFGITFYGLLDIGLGYQSHGAPENGNYFIANEWLISKNSNHSIFSVSPNGLSQSKIGISGDETITEGLSAVFKLETFFGPESGQLADAPSALTNNAGVALANQSSNADSSRAGQIFAGAAYGGLKSDTFGTLTFGRQNAISLDNINTYDPMGSSFAFSVIGYSGTTAGAGDTEDARFDQSIKYINKFGPAHVAALIKLGGYGTSKANAYQADVGAEIAGVDVDAAYYHTNNAIAAAADGATPGQLDATISDNSAYMFGAKYTLGALKVMAGYEHIAFDNPSNPYAYDSTSGAPSEPISVGGAYTINGTINQTAYNNQKDLSIIWAGVNYDLTASAKVMAAWYHISQNSYNANGCTDNSSGSCSGSENAVSLVVDNAYTKHFDTYAGVMYSEVSNGLSAAYLYTNTVDAMVGMRIRW